MGIWKIHWLLSLEWDVKDGKKKLYTSEKLYIDKFYVFYGDFSIIYQRSQRGIMNLVDIKEEEFDIIAITIRDWWKREFTLIEGVIMDEK